MVTTRGMKRPLAEKDPNVSASQPRAKTAKKGDLEQENNGIKDYACMERDALAKLCRDRDLRCGGGKVQLIE